jgi:glycerol-3-phosphate dehydrogenase
LLKACHQRGVLTKELTVDVAGLVQRLQAEIMPYGGQVFEGTEVCAATATNNGWNLQLSRNGEIFSIYSKGVMNCAGPDSARVLTSIFGRRVRFSPRTARATHITVKAPRPVSSVLFFRSSKGLGLFTMPLTDSLWRLGAINDADSTASAPRTLKAAAMHDAEAILSELAAYIARSTEAWNVLDTTTSLRMYAPPAEPEHFARSPQHVLRLDAGECPPVVSVLYARMEWLHTISESATEALLNALEKT